MFNHVVHISADAIKATFGHTPEGKDDSASIRRVLEHIEEGQMVSTEKWIASIGMVS